MLMGEREVKVRQTEEKPCEDRGRDWSDATTSPGMPGVTESGKRQQR